MTDGDGADLRAAVHRITQRRMTPAQAADLLKAAEFAVRKVRMDGNRNPDVEVVLRERVTAGLLEAIELIGEQ